WWIPRWSCATNDRVLTSAKNAFSLLCAKLSARDCVPTLEPHAHTFSYHPHCVDPDRQGVSCARAGSRKDCRAVRQGRRRVEGSEQDPNTHAGRNVYERRR